MTYPASATIHILGQRQYQVISILTSGNFRTPLCRWIYGTTVTTSWGSYPLLHLSPNPSPPKTGPRYHPSLLASCPPSRSPMLPREISMQTLVVINDGGVFPLYSKRCSYATAAELISQLRFFGTSSTTPRNERLPPSHEYLKGRTSNVQHR